jgi:hypothetical protein
VLNAGKERRKLPVLQLPKKKGFFVDEEALFFKKPARSSIAFAEASAA